MLSNSSKYALKAVLYLALYSSEEHKLMVKDFHGKINVPKAYLAKLLQELSRQKLISSTRGPKGGFYLSDENRTQPLMRFIAVIDGPSRMTVCMLSLSNCNEEKPCPLHAIFQPSRTKLINSLENLTVNDIAPDLLKSRSYLPL